MPCRVLISRRSRRRLQRRVPASCSTASHPTCCSFGRGTQRVQKVAHHSKVFLWVDLKDVVVPCAFDVVGLGDARPTCFCEARVDRGGVAAVDDIILCAVYEERGAREGGGLVDIPEDIAARHDVHGRAPVAPCSRGGGHGGAGE